MNRKKTSSKKGFSLAELLISIGILAIGMSMAAAIFPTALKEFERSHNQVMGNLICENALAMGKVVLRADDGDNSNNPAYEIRDSTTNLVDKTSVLGVNANRYPTGDPNSPLGFFIFARKLGEVHQITAVSYNNKRNGNVVVQNVNCSIAADGLSVTGNNLRIGSPLLVRGNGEFGKLEYVDDAGVSGTLDRKLTPGNNLSCFIFKYSNNAIKTSPALFVLTSRTGLQK